MSLFVNCAFPIDKAEHCLVFILNNARLINNSEFRIPNFIQSSVPVLP